MKTKRILPLVTLFFIFTMSGLYGQNLESGNLICIHHVDVTLNNDVTPKQFEDFMINDYFPEFEKNMEGVRLHLLKGDRGESKGKYAIIMYFKDSATRNKYFPEEGVVSPSGKECLEKMIPMEGKLYKMAKTDYAMTQWRVL